MAETKTQGGALDHGSRAVPGRVDQPKFTPGPWVAKPFGDDLSVYAPRDADDAFGIRVAYVDNGYAHIPEGLLLSSQERRSKSDTIRHAHAHLIAAAPDLYEALKELLDIAELFVPTRLDAPGFKRARAALAKARGEA